MKAGVRYGHDNFSLDILKPLLQYSSRKGLNPLVGEFLSLYAVFLNNVFVRPSCPAAITEFLDGGGIIGLSNSKKANRPITMVCSHRKTADKIILQ